MVYNINMKYNENIGSGRDMNKERRAVIGNPKFGKSIEERRIYYAWYRSLDRKKYNEKSKKWCDLHREKRTMQARRSHLKVKFGIKHEDYLKILEKQNKKCAICLEPYYEKTDIVGRKSPSLYVDHDHKTGKIRGLLCNNCNQAVGYFKDKKELLEKAILYIDDRAVHPDNI